MELLQDIEHLKVLAFLKACSSRFKVGLKDLSLVIYKRHLLMYIKEFKCLCSAKRIFICARFRHTGLKSNIKFLFDSMVISSLQSSTISPSLWSIENEIIAFDALSWLVKVFKTRLKLQNSLLSWHCKK